MRCHCKRPVYAKQALDFYLNSKQGDECLLGHIHKLFHKRLAGSIKGHHMSAGRSLGCIEARPCHTCQHHSMVDCFAPEACRASSMKIVAWCLVLEQRQRYRAKGILCPIPLPCLADALSSGLSCKFRLVAEGMESYSSDMCYEDWLQTA